MIRTALNISWRDHLTNEDLYGHLPKVSIKIRERPMSAAGHCVRHKEKKTSKVMLWQLQHGQTKRGRARTTYIRTLLEDTGLATIRELRTVMLHQSDWRGRIHVVRASASAQF